MPNLKAGVSAENLIDVVITTGMSIIEVFGEVENKTKITTIKTLTYKSVTIGKEDKGTIGSKWQITEYRLPPGTKVGSFIVITNTTNDG